MNSRLFKKKGNYYITDLAKCAFRNDNNRVENTRIARFNKCFDFFREEVKILNPDVIIAPGEAAYKHIKSKKNKLPYQNIVGREFDPKVNNNTPIVRLNFYQGQFWANMKPDSESLIDVCSLPKGSHLLCRWSFTQFCRLF